MSRRQQTSLINRFITNMHKLTSQLLQDHPSQKQQQEQRSLKRPRDTGQQESRRSRDFDVYDQSDEEDSEYDEDEDEEPSTKQRRTGTSQRHTHLMDHMKPKEQELVHHYYQNIGHKGSNVHQGYLDSLPLDEQRAVRKFLHAVQVKKNLGEREAEEELDEELSESDEDEGDGRQRYSYPVLPPIRRRSQPQRRTSLLDHVPPREREIIHHYYHEIGQKGGSNRGGQESASAHEPGFLSHFSDHEQDVIRTWLHSIQTYKNKGEKVAEAELESEFSAEDEEDEKSKDGEEQEEENAAAVEEPRVEMLKRLSKKEQEVLLRFYQHTGNIADPQALTKFMKSQPKEDRQTVMKFIKQLQEAGKMGRKVEKKQAAAKQPANQQQSRDPRKKPPAAQQVPSEQKSPGKRRRQGSDPAPKSPMTRLKSKAMSKGNDQKSTPRKEADGEESMGGESEEPTDSDMAHGGLVPPPVQNVEALRMAASSSPSHSQLGAKKKKKLEAVVTVCLLVGSFLFILAIEIIVSRY